MYSYFLVWSPASKPPDGIYFIRLNEKNVGILNFPGSRSFCPSITKLILAVFIPFFFIYIFLFFI